MNTGNGLDKEEPAQPVAPVADDPPSNPQRREYTRKVIAQLLAQANAIEELPRLALLSPQKVDGTAIVMGSLMNIQRALALILDDELAHEGQSRTIRLTPQDKGIIQ